MTETGPVSIGDTLKNRRLEKGKTLEEATAALRIQTRFLKALEEERWGELPATVFLEGFLVKYAEYLGLDAVALRSALREKLGNSTSPAFTHPSPVVDSVDGDSIVPLRLFLFGLAILALVGGGILFFRRQEPPGPSPAKPLNQVTEVEVPLPSTGTVAAAAPEEGPAPVPPTNLNTVVVRAKEPVWVRVRADDMVRFEGTLIAGDVRSWTFSSTLRLRVGNVSRAIVSVNGKDVGETTVASPGDVFWPPKNGGEPSFQLPLTGKILLPEKTPDLPVRLSTATVPANP